METTAWGSNTNPDEILGLKSQYASVHLHILALAFFFSVCLSTWVAIRAVTLYFGSLLSRWDNVSRETEIKWSAENSQNHVTFHMFDLWQKAVLTPGCHQASPHSWWETDMEGGGHKAQPQILPQVPEGFFGCRTTQRSGGLPPWAALSIHC